MRKEHTLIGPASTFNKLFLFLAAATLLVQPAGALPPELAGYDPAGQVRFATPEAADARRRKLVEWIWPGGLPVDALPQVSRDIGLEVFAGELAGIDGARAASVDRLDAEVAPYGFHSVMYLVHPATENANSRRLAIIHSGHRRKVTEWAGLDAAANRLLAEGFTLLLADMPLYGWNTDNTVELPGEGGTVTIRHEYSGRPCPHDDLFAKLTPHLPDGAVFRFFLEPVVQGVNHFLKSTPGAEDVTMIGLSGGGWTTHMSAAVDPRIRLSIPVAGSYPLYARPFARGSTGDTEQIYPPLYGEKDTDGDSIPDTAAGVASWLEIYALGGYGPGRRQIQVLNFKDTCCFHGDLFETYDDFVSGLVSKLGLGAWDLHSDTTHDKHMVSADVLDSVILPALGLGAPAEIEPIEAPFAMPQLRRPAFPDRTFDIVAYGATEGGKVKCTTAFAKAINACHKAGGGKVVVPAGKWLTGPIELKSNVHLFLSGDSELIFSDRFEDYLPVVFTRYAGIECYNYSPFIRAENCENIAITGPGLLNGNGARWWPWKKRKGAWERILKVGADGIPVKDRVFGTPEGGLRPPFIQPTNCRNVLLEGFRLKDGAFWTVLLLYCENAIVRDLTIRTHHPNGDGVNADSSRNVLIEHCRFETDDAAVAIKSGRDEDGRRVGKPSENIVVRHCRSKGPRYGSISIGSEMSGGVRNVYIKDIQFDGTLMAFQIKTRPGRGGVVENVWVENLVARDLHRPAFFLNTAYGGAVAPGDLAMPRLRNIFGRNIFNTQAAESKCRPIEINGLEAAPIENVRLENVTCEGKPGPAVSLARRVRLDNFRVTVREGPAFTLRDCREVTISNSTVCKPCNLFVHVEGETSAAIRLQDNDLRHVRGAVRLGEKVPATAVKRKGTRP